MKRLKVQVKGTGMCTGLEMGGVKVHSRNWRRQVGQKQGSMNGCMPVEGTGGVGRDQTMQGFGGPGKNSDT